MNSTLFNLLLLCALLCSCHSKSGEDSTERKVQPIAQVQTIKLNYANISSTLTVYGAVQPLPSALKTLNVPYSSRIENVYVSNGQTIHKGNPLLSLKPNEDAQLAITQARNDLLAAEQELKLLQQRVELKLATQQDLITGRNRVAQAQALVQDLTARGALHTLTADTDGVIVMVNVQPGQRLAAASPLLQWLKQNQWGVYLGVEPENIAQLRTRQQVLLTPINRTVSKPISGTIELITQEIDPVTHLLNIVVKPAVDSGLLLNEIVQGRIRIASKKTFVAPRAAVLPDEEAYSVFTVINHHAVKHKIQLGLENDKEVEMIAPTLKAQDELVILGNYELQDGMAVETLQCNVSTTDYKLQGRKQP